MSETPFPKEPQLVLNPANNNYVNIAPIFKLLNDRCYDKPQVMADNMEAVIRFISLFHDTKETESMELKNVLGLLFEVKDMFSNMSEFKNG